MNIEDLYPYITPELPDCPSEMLRQALVQTAIDLCKETLVWNEIADAVKLSDGLDEYDIDYPSGARPLTAPTVWLGPHQLVAISMEQLSVYLPDWQTSRSNEPRFYNISTDFDVIKVFPRPLNPTGSLRMKGAFIPRLNAVVLPDFLADYYLDAITAGAKARLMLKPNQKWTSEQTGAFYQGEYLRLRTDARIDAIANRVPGITQVKPVRFGARR